jgi:hypothetical protein
MRADDAQIIKALRATHATGYPHDNVLLLLFKCQKNKNVSGLLS